MSGSEWSVRIGTAEPVDRVRRTLAAVLNGTDVAASGVLARIQVPGFLVDLEADDTFDGFDYVVDVFAVGPSAGEFASELMAKLAGSTPWRLASDFDDDDRPLDERPALAAQ